ncbi:hypothetical protein PGT21_015792 [Puccinia graminis f. sp. tritici]|uniref:Uncharacterized protein n=1 Tax=Puccinia graminis f. sp. tritici TaxID=56615 RepID=A0A5B0LNN8_PUCGR|nr:hypothetical protein PGTUg99_021666 [Puccinia graminis f. sp. tritici]KAA1090858.1 hypothetical protein PGT21_015792 [Puccinia graminis f. sp. tritici]
MSRITLLDMFMAVTNARREAQAADSRQEQASGSAANDDAQTPRAGPSRAKAPIATLEQWNYSSSSEDRKPRKKKIPFLSHEAKQSTTSDLWARAFSRSTAHPGGARHPRVYTLIGQSHQTVPLVQRRTPSSPADPSPEEVDQTDAQQPQPLPPPPPSSQVRPARQKRRTSRTAPYADNRRGGARGSAAGEN